MSKLEQLRAQVVPVVAGAMARGEEGAPAPAAADPRAGWQRGGNVGLLEVSRIVVEGQPREHFDDDELARLADSVRKHGILQPILVRWDGAAWVLVWGERRLRASRAAGLATIPARSVDQPLTPAEVLDQQAAENLQRRDWQPLEAAAAIASIMEARQWTQQEVCAGWHLSPAWVSRTLALAQLHPDAQRLVASGELSPTAAVELRVLAPDDQAAVAAAAAAGGLTVEETAAAVAVQLGKAARPKRIPHQRARHRVPGGWVTVQLDGGALSPAAQLAAVEHVARSLRRAAKDAA